MKQPRKRNVITRLIITAILACIIALPLMTAIAYPTQKHQEIAREIEIRNSKAWQEGRDFTEFYNSNEYNELASSSENKYSEAVRFVSWAASGLLLISLPGWLYYRLRRARATNRPVALTVLIVVGAEIIAANILDPLVTKYLIGVYYPDFSGFLVGTISSILITTLIVMLFTYGWQGYYNKHNNFVVE